MQIQNDVLITYDSGMTGVVNKFQSILGLKVSESLKKYTSILKEIRPIVFISHMEHHSYQTSWLETIADVVVMPCNDEGLIYLELFESCIKKHEHRKIKIVSMTSCANVTGIKTQYHKVAKLIHSYNGLCFVDFACCAPYVHIDTHPKDEAESLDAIYFSPHKFLGGPGSAGFLVFNKRLYKNTVPDNPGRSTVSYTNPWVQHNYFDDVEIREDAGTPAFL
jgi:selenocysteine lyase/cysteine desulfurase